MKLNSQRKDRIDTFVNIVHVTRDELNIPRTHSILLPILIKSELKFRICDRKMAKNDS